MNISVTWSAIVTTFIAYIAALITMLLGLIGTLFETRRAGQLTRMGRVAVGLIIVSGLTALAAHYLAGEAEKARAIEADTAREAAIARSEESLRALAEAREQIAQLGDELAASRRREELDLMRCANARLVARVRFDQQVAFSEGPWADRYAFLVDEGTDFDPRISAAAVALCDQDTPDLCVVDYFPEPSQVELAEGNARGGPIGLSAAYTSQLWSALRDGPLESRLYPPPVALSSKQPDLECETYPEQTFQYVFLPREPGQSLYDEIAINTTQNPVPVCIPPTPAGSLQNMFDRFWRYSGGRTRRCGKSHCL